MLSHDQWKFAIKNAIDAVGLDRFKQTSMFMSAESHETRQVEREQKAA